MGSAQGKNNRDCDLAQRQCSPCQGGIPPLKGGALTALMHQLGGGWNLVEDHHLEKEFIFRNFREALAFTNRVGEIAEQEKHHPDLFLSYGRVKIQLWTHKIDGLSENDFIFAAKCNRLMYTEMT